MTTVDQAPRYRALARCGHTIRVRRQVESAWCPYCQEDQEIDVVDWGAHRYCLDCNAKLSRYNPDVFCAPCQARHAEAHRKMMEPQVLTEVRIYEALPGRVTEVAARVEGARVSDVYLILNELVKNGRVVKRKDGPWTVFEGSS